MAKLKPTAEAVRPVRVTMKFRTCVPESPSAIETSLIARVIESTVVLTEPVLLLVMASPPPATAAVLVTEAGALLAIVTGIVSVVDAPAASTVLRVQLTLVAVDAVQFQPVSGLVTKVARCSWPAHRR